MAADQGDGERNARETAVRQRLVGNWRLVSFEPSSTSSQAAQPYVDGRIMYDENGNMAAQLMRANRPKATSSSTDSERLAALQGYIAYYGTYDIDVAAETVTHHVKGSTNSSQVGTDLVRHYRFSDDGRRLVLLVKNADRVTTTITWERLGR
jgi:hypothetical protein